MQLAIHRADQSKLFPMIVLRQKRQSALFLALCDCRTLCPDSDSLRRASSRACSPKIQAFASSVGQPRAKSECNVVKLSVTI